ncbi:MAG: type transporter [Amycolatopsis sp.]|uniref:ABC transporter permease n=1 Tax=Amycolatopsis sp. TaxID=37632 RepID=UPI0026197EB9|nr:ABC transporter permease [Amycolatopsis sp.]MCU1686684.1 type transporter [Amycolatopsis sp.]
MTTLTSTRLPALPTGPGAAAVEIFALAGRRLRHLLRAPGRLIGVIMNPLVTMIAMGYLFKTSIVVPGGGNYPEYLMAGAAVQVGLASVGPTAIAVSMDLKGGLVDRFRSLPISRTAVLIGHTLADLVSSLAGLVVVMLVGFALDWRPNNGFLGLLAGFGVLAVFIYVMLWVGVLLGMCVSSLESIDSFGGLIVVVFSFMSSAFLASSQFPNWIRPFAEWNPVSSVSNAVRRLWGNPVASGDGFALHNPGVVIVIALGVVLTVTTVLSFRRYRTAS